MRTALCSALFVLAMPLLAASIAQPPSPSPELLTDLWTARWVTDDPAAPQEFGVRYFRKTFELAEVPKRFVVHASADARYRLFVNGHSVCFGPQRSGRLIWRFESVDLAPWLHAGRNVVAAEVVSYGPLAPPYAIERVKTGFVLQGDGAAERILDTNTSWKVQRSQAYAPLTVDLHTYLVTAPGLRVDGATIPWGWLQPDFDDSGWAGVREMDRARPYAWGTDIDHWLKPRSIPLMEETPERFASVRRAEGVSVPAGFLEGAAPLLVPANTRATLLLDHGTETNAFPNVSVSGGKDSRIRLVYAEALVDANGQKGNRNEIDGRTVVGVTDEFLPDGGANRVFTSLEFRTYRYVQLEIETGSEPLRLDECSGVFTGYPFTERGRFGSDDPELKRIWEVGWRTARLCAFETYVDCPYYEQLQYVGDTRIQALISLYVAGDDRLMRNAIELYDLSRVSEGVTQSRYPSVVPQLINTFSLFWVEMVHDYWMHRTDEAFVRARLSGVRAVLEWFEKRVDPATGLLGKLDYWTFVDWTDEWPWDDARGIGGEPPGARTGGSSIVTLQFAMTLDHAAELSRAFGEDRVAERYAKLSAGLKAAVVRTCWDEKRKVFADTPEKGNFSQHANAFAVLAGLVQGDAAKDLIRRTMDDGSLVQASTYFRFYLLRAMKHAGLGDQYLAQLGPWRTMLDRGLTTFAEKPDPTRSDCHAWSASPVYELLATVCGVEPSSPGFTTARIEPHLGNLRQVVGVVPHPRGEIRVKLERTGTSGISGEVTLPEGVTGDFRWNGKRTSLRTGSQSISFE